MAGTTKAWAIGVIAGLCTAALLHASPAHALTVAQAQCRSTLLDVAGSPTLDQTFDIESYGIAPNIAPGDAPFTLDFWGTPRPLPFTPPGGARVTRIESFSRTIAVNGGSFVAGSIVVDPAVIGGREIPGSAELVDSQTLRATSVPGPVSDTTTATPDVEVGITGPPGVATVVVRDVRFDTVISLLGRVRTVCNLRDTPLTTTVLSGIPLVTVESDEVTAPDRGTTTAVLTVRLSGPSTQTVKVDYRTFPEDAREGEDYKHTAGTLSFPPGTTTKTVSVKVFANTPGEPYEWFYFGLHNAVNATVDGPPAWIRIWGNGPLDVSLVAAPRINEGDTGTRDAVVGVALSRPTTGAVNVKYEIEPITATAGVDYKGTRGSVKIKAGTTRAQIKVPVVSDTQREFTERFRVTISAAQGATIVNGTTVVVIDDDD